MLPNSCAFNVPVQLTAWSDVARLCRRICLARERGALDEAEQLRTGSLAVLLDTLRPLAASLADFEQRIEAIFAAEAERVAQAATLAELLAPLLSERMRLAPTPYPALAAVDFLTEHAPTVEHAAATRSPTAESDTTPPFAPIPSPSAAASPPPARHAPGNIADFIDDMLAQERSTRRPPPTPERRAS